MKKLLVVGVVALTLLGLVGCLKPSAAPKLSQGYYVVFNFQYKPSDGAETVTVLPGLKMEEVAEGEYELTVKKKDLAPIIEGHDKDGVYWWTVAYVDDPDDKSTWIFYGGTDEYSPSVPFLKDDFDALADDANVEFYATVPDSTDTIIGLGDNLKDGRDFYFVGTPNGWTHQKMEYKGDGVYELDVTMDDYHDNIEYKVWPADTWDASETLKALAFNGVHYYATGGNGTYTFEKPTREFKVSFDLHHSLVTFEPIDAVDTIASVKEKLLADPSTTFQATVVGVVTYDYSSYIVVQDDTDALKVYKSGIGAIFDRGDKVWIAGEAKVYKGTDFEIVPSASELISEDNPEPIPEDITGKIIDDASPLYGKLVYFKGTAVATDSYDNVTFDSSGATITVKDYIGYDWTIGREYTIKGVVLYNHDRYKVVPRDEDDVEGNNIVVDGDVSDWEAYPSKTVVDDSHDAPWGDDNKIDYVGVAYDDDNIYAYATFSQSGYDNGLFFVFDVLESDPAATALTQWSKNFEVPDHDFLIGAWNGGMQVWKVSDDGTYSDDISASCTIAWSSDNHTFEIKIPKDVMGVTSDATGIKFVGVLYGGVDGSGNQWAGDFAPSQTDDGTDVSTSGNPVKIEKWAELDF